MAIFSGAGITKRLYALSFGIAVALAGLAYVSYTNLKEVGQVAEVAKSNRMPQLARMSALELDVTQVSLQLRHAMLSRTPEERNATLAYITDKRRAMDELLVSYEKALFSEEGKARFTKLPPLVKAFWEAGEANIKLIQDDQKAEAFVFLVEKTIPVRNLLLKELTNSVEFQKGKLSGEIDALQREISVTLTLIMGIAVAIVVALLLSSWAIARTLRQRATIAENVATRVRDGDLMTLLSEGDKGNDEFTPLLAALSDMQTSLTRVVSTVRMNAESVATASAEIAQGNNDLSSRTEQQASSLEETAASMEQLGATVRHNADNAKQASQLAMNASSVAVAGGDVVSQVVETMKGINDSSRKIADIIGVIDGIAFQTNILALNAAVEAARAGEQGRGFAVVAGEVRSLAQRSADAAKEIKTLISASVERVGHGTALVDKAGETMAEVVNSIKRVTDIVGEISSASQEQSMGVQQVGQAVTQMDQATQQNAALVEQSAAAADTLKVQALTLVEAVAVFQLPGGRGMGAAAPVKRASTSSTARAPVAPPRKAIPAASAPLRMAAAAKPSVQARPATALSAPKAPAPAPKAAASSGSDDWESF
jgi:methyl-accepting chemotaxis protein